MSSSKITIELNSDLAELARLSVAIDEFCEQATVPTADGFALQVVIEEVVTNIINHGYGGNTGHTFSLHLSANETSVTVEARDDAPAYDPLTRLEVDTTVPLAEREVGGLGVHLVKKMMPQVSYKRLAGHNILTLTRPLTQPPLEPLL